MIRVENESIRSILGPFRVRRLKYLVKIKRTLEMVLVQISKLFKNCLCHRNKPKNLADVSHRRVTISFFQKYAFFQCLGIKNGHDFYTDYDSSFCKFWDLDQNNSSPKFASFSANISVYEQDNRPKIDLKVFQNSKFYKFSEKRLSPTIRW